MFTSSSNFTNEVDALFAYIVILSLVVLVGITITMIYFVIRYSRKRNPIPKNIDGNLTLEVLWTVIPLVLFLSMFYFGWMGYKNMRAIPDDAIKITVTARMWEWSFEYPNGLKTDTLYVPVGKPVSVDLKSLDVSHAFFIPAFRVKKDVYPNRTTNAWFRSDNVGRYDIACAEYCGLNHSYMYSAVHIMEQKDFDSWFTQASEKAALPAVLVKKTQ